MKLNLRLLYLYLFSFVGLIITVIGSIQILNLVLKTYVFRVEENYYYPEPIAYQEPISPDEKPLPKREPKEVYTDRQRTETNNQRKRQLSNSLAMILIGGPLYLYHWHTIKREQKS